MRLRGIPVVLTLCAVVGGCGDDTSSGPGGGAGAPAAGTGGMGTAGAPGGGGMTSTAGMATGGMGVAGLPGTGGMGGASTAMCTGLNLPAGQPIAVISEVQVGVGVELYNPGTVPVDLGTLYLCVNFGYTTNPVTTGLAIDSMLAPGAYVNLPWDAATWVNGTSDAGGDVLLYTGSGIAFPDTNNSIDFVCWGDGNPTASRLSTAQDAGIYSGTCAAAIPTGGSVQRVAGSDGASAASYMTATTPGLQTCTP